MVPFASPRSLAWIDQELALLDARGLRRHLATHETGDSGETILVGQRMLNFGSNDYLGLAADPRLAEAATEGARRWGSGASPLVCGRTPLHAALESQLAELKQTPAALVFPSGYAANTGAITSLVERGDAIFGDQKNHASIIDGCRLSRATIFVYPHNDCTALEEQLRSANGFRRRLIVTDTLFSMDGDWAPLTDLADLAQRYGAMLMVDEAHATGVLGLRGGGLVDALNLHDAVSIRVGTLSKALGSAGGFVAGSGALIEWLANRARPYVFSTAQPAACCAATLAALAIVAQEPQRRTALIARATELRTALTAQGWNVGRGTSQIIPIQVGKPEEALRLAAALRQQGIFVPAIRPPSVPEGESLLRISLSYAHTPAMLTRLADSLNHLRQS